MSVISPDSKRIYTAKPVDSKNRPAPISDVPVWTVVPEGGVLLFPSADGMTCEVVWHAQGTQTVYAAAHNAGGTEITGSVLVETTPALAVAINLVEGPEQPL